MAYQKQYTIAQLHSLVGDYVRTNAYAQWLMSGVCSGMTVVDCGAGSGLCTWLALRGGASRVIAIDCSTEVCEYLRGQFGHIPQVSVHQLDLCHDDIPKGDIYIHELVGNALLGEGMSQIFHNMRSQGITNIYPHHTKISVGIVTHDKPQLAPVRDHRLITVARDFTNFCNNYHSNNVLTRDYPNLSVEIIEHVHTGSLRDPMPQHLKELNREGDIIWEVGFDSQFENSYTNVTPLSNNWNASTPYAEFVKWCNVESFVN